MQTYICLLRGINVGGHKKIKMDALRSMFEDLGFEQVKTYIQSGNVIFRAQPTDSFLMATEIQAKIKEVFTFDVPVMVITQAEAEAVFANNPFVNIHNRDINNMHVTFLSDQPEPANLARLTGDFGEDEFAVGEKAIYIHLPERYKDTKLSNSFFESKLKLSATTRNWKTVTALVGLARATDQKFNV
jgi:uncharacterized protein (DUF1697 family)